MKFKNPLRLAFLSVFSMCIFSGAIAATDSSVIEISHTYTPYVKFTGTAPGISRFYDNNDVVPILFGVSTNIGTLGLESNVGGNCNIDFTTANNFELIHTDTGNDTSFGEYNIQYESKTFSRSSNPQLELLCTSAATDLNFIISGPSVGGIDALVAAGVYQDVISVTVTTQ